MKVAAHTGLAPMRVKRTFGRFTEGATVRLSPSDAKRFGEFLEPAGVKGKTVEVKAGEPEMVSTRILNHPSVAIPDDWLSMHRLQRAKLAEQIAGGAVKTEDADGVIQAEIERRKGA